jgi:ferredoxin
MMNALLPALGLWGVLPEDIRTEAFGPASVLPSKGESMPSVSGAAAPMDIVFRGSDRTLVWDGQDRNLLDFGERHGLALESGCRSGSCGSCAVKLVSGTVRYAREPDAEVTPGHCLPCVCVPSSPLVLEVRGS